MNELIKATKQHLIAYRLAWLIGILFSINALCTSIGVALANTEWEDISATSKFLTIILIIGTWTNTILAFLNKTMSRLQDKKDILEAISEQTDFVKKP